jgi:hypothetical protein
VVRRGGDLFEETLEAILFLVGQILWWRNRLAIWRASVLTQAATEDNLFPGCQTSLSAIRFIGDGTRTVFFGIPRIVIKSSALPNIL